MSLLRSSGIRERLSSIIVFSEKIKNSKISARVKGSFLGNWGKYWKNIYLDYKDVVVDTTKACKERPIRALTYFSILGISYYIHQHNPDELSFREALLQYEMKLMFVGENVRNPVSTNHILFLDDCLNRNIIRRMNLGLLSLVWLDNYHEKCAHYKATCAYLKPRYMNFHKRIIDIGFLDKWWILESKMKDYDINDNEINVNNYT
ncbi:hypothetical protein PV328_007056 [Microctonus aethiopoides]|uniref:Mitochondrial import inner membrane translocase subunit Tim29 n=1 Tax=Microctonus aethiopoides TaxID=144406 RepID=A0AA39KU73_9HYME|nr:hypothetical protein PV328_007056 [Microctonus aethiopoides]